MGTHRPDALKDYIVREVLLGPKAQKEFYMIMTPVYFDPHRPDTKKDYTVREASLGPQSPTRILLDYDTGLFGPTPPRCQKNIIQSEKLHWAHKAQ